MREFCAQFLCLRADSWRVFLLNTLLPSPKKTKPLDRPHKTMACPTPLICSYLSWGIFFPNQEQIGCNSQHEKKPNRLHWRIIFAGGLLQPAGENRGHDAR